MPEITSREATVVVAESESMVMSIQVECPECGNGLRIKDKFAGQHGKCPKCEGLITVPEKTSEERSTSQAMSFSKDSAELDPSSQRESAAATPRSLYRRIITCEKRTEWIGLLVSVFVLAIVCVAASEPPPYIQHILVRLVVVGIVLFVLPALLYFLWTRVARREEEYLRAHGLSVLTYFAGGIVFLISILLAVFFFFWIGDTHLAPYERTIVATLLVSAGAWIARTLGFRFR